MESDLFNLLVGGGPFGGIAAFMFWRWQKTENEFRDYRAAADIKVEAGYKAMIDLQEKRLTDGVRIEGVLQSNTSAMASQTQLLQAIVNRSSP